MGLGGGVIFTIYNASTGKVEVINARETVPASHVPGLLDQCKQAQPLGTGAQWIGVPGELRGYAEAHRRHGRLPWAQLFGPTIALLRGGLRVPRVLSRFLHSSYLRPSLHASSLRQLFFNGTEPLSPHDPLPWPALAATLETVAAEGAEALYTGRLGQILLEDVAKEGSQLTPQDLASFRPEVVDALEVPLGNYTLYSPPPPAGGAILSFVLNVLKGFNFSAESVARPEGRVNLYHHLVETLKFARGQRWRLWDPRSHPEVQNASQDLLGEALAQHIHQQIDSRGDHQLSHYSLAGTWSHRMGTAHVSVLGEDGSAVSATSTINTPFGAMVYSPRTGILLNNELLDLCWRHPRGSGVTPPPVPGERPPSSMVPSILVNAAQGSKLVIGGAGGELIISAVAQAIMNKLWLGLDLQAAIAAPILHVDGKGRVEYEPSFSQDLCEGSQTGKCGDQAPKQCTQALRHQHLGPDALQFHTLTVSDLSLYSLCSECLTLGDRWCLWPGVHVLGLMGVQKPPADSSTSGALESLGPPSSHAGVEMAGPKPRTMLASGPFLLSRAGARC
ncbi:glutathione hydrolase 5 proenzyme isoform 2-T2 [Megaptera novaeangliae]